MSTIEEYQQAVSALTSAKAEVERIVAIVTSGSDALRNWRTTNIVHPGYKGHTSAESRQTQTLKTSTWPTGADIVNSLQAYHTANQHAKSAWDAMPNDSRTGFGAPDTFS